MRISLARVNYSCIVFYFKGMKKGALFYKDTDLFCEILALISNELSFGAIASTKTRTGLT